MTIRDNLPKNLNGLKGKYIVFERYIDDGVRMMMPGKLLDIKGDMLLIRQHDNGDGVDWSRWEELIDLKDILYLDELKNV